MNGKVIIRKYENRRLYDTSASRYINLDDIAKMVRDGVEVQVLDARTGEDLTRSILTQIIVDDARNRQSGLPLDFLRQMVIASGRASQESLSTYLRTMSQMYQGAYGALAGGVNPFEFVSRFFPGAAAATPPAEAAAPPEPEPAPAPPAEEAELSELRRRVDELEKRIRAGRKAARPRKKRT